MLTLDIESTNITWQPLKAGDRVDIIAPSAKCHPAALQQVNDLLASWGLVGQYPLDIFGDELIYANSDEKRLFHLVEALTKSPSKAVWCLLGGYGATRLLSRLANVAKPEQVKLFIGFSDTTALHIFLQDRWGWPTLHAISARQAANNTVAAESIQLLRSILLGEEPTLLYRDLVPLNQHARREAILHAPLTGGNLHLVQASIGTGWQIDTKDKIILLEDVNERAYRIDRVLTHLSQAGLFHEAKAILLGDFTGGAEPNGMSLVPATIQTFADACEIPVWHIPGVGHGEVNNPIVLGANAKLEMGETGRLSFILPKAN